MTRRQVAEPPHTCRSRYCAGAVVTEPVHLLAGDLIDISGMWVEVQDVGIDPEESSVHIGLPGGGRTYGIDDVVTVLCKDKHVDARPVVWR